VHVTEEKAGEGYQVNWRKRQEEAIGELAPDVGRFVRMVLVDLEHENVFDAPGVISGVLRKMRVADSDVIRGAASRTERLLKTAFARGCLQRIGA